MCKITDNFNGSLISDMDVFSLLRLVIIGENSEVKKISFKSKDVFLKRILEWGINKDANKFFNFAVSLDPVMMPILHSLAKGDFWYWMRNGCVESVFQNDWAQVEFFEKAKKMCQEINNNQKTKKRHSLKELLYFPIISKHLVIEISVSKNQKERLAGELGKYIRLFLKRELTNQERFDNQYIPIENFIKYLSNEKTIKKFQHRRVKVSNDEVSGFQVRCGHLCLILENKGVIKITDLYDSGETISQDSESLIAIINVNSKALDELTSNNNLQLEDLIGFKTKGFNEFGGLKINYLKKEMSYREGGWMVYNESNKEIKLLFFLLEEERVFSSFEIAKHLDIGVYFEDSSEKVSEETKKAVRDQVKMLRDYLEKLGMTRDGAKKYISVRSGGYIADYY